MTAGAEKLAADCARRSPGEVLKDAGSIPATSTDFDVVVGHSDAMRPGDRPHGVRVMELPVGHVLDIQDRAHIYRHGIPCPVDVGQLQPQPPGLLAAGASDDPFGQTFARAGKDVSEPCSGPGQALLG